MKTIIGLFLVLAFCQASAQKSGWTMAIFEDAIDSTGWTTIVGKDTTTRFPPYSALAILTLLQVHSAYERDCWNDSTLVEGARFKDWPSGGEFWMRYQPRAGMTDGNLICLENRWIHRQPTFEGFIQWLRKEAGK